MKNAEGFKFMKSQKAGGQGRGPNNNNNVMTGPRPYFNRDGGKFGGQKYHQGQGNIWRDNQIQKQQVSSDVPQRKLQPWSGLGANQAEEGSNHRVVRDLNAQGFQKKSAGGFQRKSGGKSGNNLTDEADPFSVFDQTTDQPSQVFRPKAQSNI